MNSTEVRCEKACRTGGCPCVTSHAHVGSRERLITCCLLELLVSTWPILRGGGVRSVGDHRLGPKLQPVSFEVLHELGELQRRIVHAALWIPRKPGCGVSGRIALRLVERAIKQRGHVRMAALDDHVLESVRDAIVLHVWPRVLLHLRRVHLHRPHPLAVAELLGGT